MGREKCSGRTGWHMLIFNFILLALSLTACLAVNVFAEEEGSEVITVRFLDAYGGSAGLDDLTIAPGESIVLPKTPADSKAPDKSIIGAPAWKPTKGTYDNLLKSPSVLTYEQVLSLCRTYGSSNVLTLYGTKVLYVAYYINDGTKMIWRMYAYEGARIQISGSLNQNNPAYKGWTEVKNGTGVVYSFKEMLQLKKNMNLYLVTYARIRYYSKNGSKLLYSGYYKRGTKATLPAVPALTNYRAMGWSLLKSGSKIYAVSGVGVKVSKDLDLYAAYKYLPYTVKFTNNNGKTTSTAFSKLNMRAAAGDSITLPKLPAVSNRIAAGWSTKANDTTARIKAGAQVKIWKNVTYYAVYRDPRTLNITFVDQNGSTSDTFNALKITVKEGTKFKLPAVPKKDGYAAIGWRLKINDRILDYNAGATIAVYGNCRFYAYYQGLVQLIFHYNGGGKYNTVKVGKGASYSLPSMVDPDGYTFMGWATHQGMYVSPANPSDSYYKPGTNLKVTGAMHLYAVLMDRSAESIPAPEKFSGPDSPDTSAYKEIIFMGDSRTERLQRTIGKQGINTSEKNVHFISKGGAGLTWLKGTGYPQLLEELGKADSDDKRPIAVIFNFGVNDLYKLDSYTAFYKSIEPTLKQKNCRLFIMSVNPVNSAIHKKRGMTVRDEYSVISFNTSIKSSLAGKYTFLDTYTWLMKTGWSYDGGSMGYDAGWDDGLHYTVATYLRIYLKALQLLGK